MFDHNVVYPHSVFVAYAACCPRNMTREIDHDLSTMVLASGGQYDRTRL